MSTFMMHLLLPGLRLCLVSGFSSHEMRNELRRVDGRAQQASVKRNGSWSFKNPPARALERRCRLRREKYYK
jgi:hypothetical protein